MLRLTRGVILLALAVPAAPAWPQAWPVKPVRMIVNANAGGSTDVMARSMASDLATSLGQPVLIDNRAGAGGGIGIELVARSGPDGYTLLHAADSGITVGPHLYKLQVDVAKELQPIAPTGRAALFFIVRNGLPAKTLPEFVAYLRANPGKANYGSAGYGTLQHIAAEMLLREAKVTATHVAYKGSQRVLVDLLGGQVDFTFDLGAAVAQIKSGEVRLLAVPARTRSPIFPDAPTMIEAGTNLDISWISGVYGPVGMPGETVSRLNREITRIMHTVETRARLSAMAAEPMPPMTPEAFAKHQQVARDRFGKVIRDANIRID